MVFFQEWWRGSSDKETMLCGRYSVHEIELFYFSISQRWWLCVVLLITLFRSNMKYVGKRQGSAFFPIARIRVDFVVAIVVAHIFKIQSKHSVIVCRYICHSQMEVTFTYISNFQIICKYSDTLTIASAAICNWLQHRLLCMSDNRDGFYLTNPFSLALIFPFRFI